MEKHGRFYALIPAAGSSTRMGRAISKQYLVLAGKTVLEHSVNTFLQHPRFSKILVVLQEQDLFWQTLPIAHHPNIIACVGAESRMLSVYNGLLALSQVATHEDWICVHDAARCLLHAEDLEALLQRVHAGQQGAILASKVHDTVKQSVDVAHHRIKTQCREALWLAQTPQIFRYRDLLEAFSRVISEQQTVTDEAEAIEKLDLPIQLVQAKHPNFKLTTEQDVVLAQSLLAAQES